MTTASRVDARAISRGPSNRHGEAGQPGSPVVSGVVPHPREVVGRMDRRPDRMAERNGIRFAGTHLIIDPWRADRLDDRDAADRALRTAAEAAGASLLDIDLHCFTPNSGITGLAMLASSHISIHTWPERAYAAVDVFMCGDADPHRAVQFLKQAFSPTMMMVAEHKRGVMP